MSSHVCIEIVGQLMMLSLYGGSNLSKFLRSPDIYPETGRYIEKLNPLARLGSIQERGYR
jgi:hypothetical protein